MDTWLTQVSGLVETLIRLFVLLFVVGKRYT